MMPALTTKSIHRILKHFAKGLSFYGLFFIGVSAYRYFFDGWKPGVFSYHALVDYFDLNAIYVSVMVSLSLLYMLFYAQRKTTDRLVIALLAIFLLLLASKNVLAVTTLAFFLGALLYGKLTRRKALLIALAAAFLTAAMFYGPIKKRWNAELNTDLAEVFTCDSFGIFYPWTGTTIRLFQARMFYELLQENNIFLTGFGINAAQEKVAETQNQYDVYCGYNTYNFHNQYLQVFAELGVVGLLILLLLLGFIFKGYLKTRELIYLFFFLITASVFLSETYIWRQRGLIHFLVLYGLLIKLAASIGGIKKQQ